MISTLEKSIDKDMQEAARLYLANLKLTFENDGKPTQLMKLREVKDELCISDAVLRQLMLDPSFPRIMVGRKVLVPRIALVKYVSNRSENWYKF